MLTNPRNAMLCRPAKFDEGRMMRGRVIAYCRFQNDGRPPSWILIFSQFLCEKFKFSPISSSYKICWRAEDARPSYCVFSIFKMAAVRHLGFLYFRIFCEKKFVPISSSSYKIWWRSDDARRLHIFDFQNGGRPPSWIWYDISGHPRLVFDGPSILLKLHVDPVNILRDIAIFIFGPFGLKLPIHAQFWGIWRGSPWN